MNVTQRGRLAAIIYSQTNQLGPTLRSRMENVLSSDYLKN